MTFLKQNYQLLEVCLLLCSSVLALSCAFQCTGSYMLLYAAIAYNCVYGIVLSTLVRICVILTTKQFQFCVYNMPNILPCVISHSQDCFLSQLIYEKVITTVHQVLNSLILVPFLAYTRQSDSEMVCFSGPPDNDHHKVASISYYYLSICGLAVLFLKH